MLEKNLHPNGILPGKGDIVASNLGDVSPNISCPRYMDTGLPCDGSCDRQSDICIAHGTRSDIVDSTELIGRR